MSQNIVVRSKTLTGSDLVKCLYISLPFISNVHVHCITVPSCRITSVPTELLSAVTQTALSSPLPTVGVHPEVHAWSALMAMFDDEELVQAQIEHRRLTRPPLDPQVRKEILRVSGIPHIVNSSANRVRYSGCLYNLV